VFTARPGPAIVVGLLDLGTRLRLVANLVDTVTPPEDLPRLPVARALWRPRPDLATAAEAWLLAGGPHHTCYTQAIDLECLEDLAEMAGLELVTIDSTTEMRSFRRELRWSQVYWHLAGAL
jgi:L-arabinose isomerase